MTIHLPDDLQRFVQAKVESGQFPSEEAAVAEAVRRFQLWEEQVATPAPPEVDSSLGSVGAMRDDVELLDEIVADAYCQRQKDTWRDLNLD